MSEARGLVMRLTRTSVESAGRYYTRSSAVSKKHPRSEDIRVLVFRSSRDVRGSDGSNYLLACGA